MVRPPASGPWDYSLLSGIGSSVNRIPSLLPNNEDELPPLLIITGENEAGGTPFTSVILGARLTQSRLYVLFGVRSKHSQPYEHLWPKCFLFLQLLRIM